MNYIEDNLKSLLGLAALEKNIRQMPEYKVYGELTGSRQIMANLEVTLCGRKIIHITIPSGVCSHRQADIVERVARLRPHLFDVAIQMCNTYGISEIVDPSETPIIWSNRDN